MNEYKFEVTEQYSPGPLGGTTFSESIESAVKELKEWYAMELGTVESEINVKIELA